ncbi:hypothetical protein GUITHDRAFT_80002 [Guillardia theta CCMP2712]|uniref:Mitogen-activated protein kinase n=1 Tax=Guillardia theta (strain CCMP2712) TaxID=905079 RepID=L1IH61_GUITC|nr:hypothetical protein GUITHDRAFT_80002 [Guillardia theta CCMP2712]EKX35254.1 hypothetical protein GUITHDRAFT_80002 [Guillardia theta CCMP2712]|eukprot:XP_005822234.1 hypothetical protein GUITHDRAFT_80002 [Guillardia theta CCMP2712]
MPFSWKQFSVCGSRYCEIVPCQSPSHELFRFVLPDYYSVIKPIGQGAYGIVCSATNQRTGKNVAIKKIANAFEHVIDTKRTLREAKLLRMIKHENVISIEDILPPVDFVSFNDVYVISELMDTDLHQIITSPQPLSDDHVQYFMYQILRGMKYIHSLDVVHRDLKPSNLLVNSNCDLKICDFGLARALGPADDQSSFLTEYVATRWYRAPEVLVSWCRYSKALDMWSVGCILAELLGRKPIFPGKNFKHQIELICNILGTPTSEDLVGVTSERAKQYLENLLPRPKKDFKMIYTAASAPAIELLEMLLTFDPDRRFTVEQALACNFLSSLHDENDEPRAEHPLNFDWVRLLVLVLVLPRHLHPPSSPGSHPFRVLVP